MCVCVFVKISVSFVYFLFVGSISRIFRIWRQFNVLQKHRDGDGKLHDTET